MSREATAPVELRLDHATVEVPALADAVTTFDRWGLVVTVSPEAPERHGRIHLDRAYLEVAADAAATAWAVTHFFLRFSNRQRLCAHLDRAGFRYQHQVYEGVDGRWDDVGLDLGDVPAPILVRRLEPVEVARDWPPALDRPHPCGASRLAAVHVPVTRIAGAVDLYARLLRSGPPRPVTGSDGRRRVEFRAGAGSIVLTEGGGPLAVVLGVESLDASRTAPRQPLATDATGVAWLPASSGPTIGLTEAGRTIPGA